MVLTRSTILRTGIDAMTDHSDLIERLRAACVGHPSASIAWPHRILHEAVDALSSHSLSLSEAREEIERLKGLVAGIRATPQEPSRVEAVARAIARETHKDGDYGLDGDTAYEARPGEFQALARAAIAAFPKEFFGECAPYLKDGETPRERMDRDFKDTQALTELLAEARRDRDIHNGHRRMAEAKLMALGSGGVVGGCVLVPVEPTDEMLAATCDDKGRMRMLEFTRPEERSAPFLVPRYAYRAMVQAARSAKAALENGPADLADATNDPADLSSLRKGAEVAVKPLEWVKKRKGSGTIYTADGVDAAIVDNHGMGFQPGVRWNGEQFSTVENAKVAAQADYEARILSALASDATPAPTSGSETEPVAVKLMRSKAEWHAEIGRRRDRVFSSDEVLEMFAALAKPASEPAGGVREALERLKERERDTNWHPFYRDGLMQAIREIDAALSSSAGPAEPVTWRYRIFRETDKWTYETRKAEVDCRRNANYEIQPLYAHPAPATVEMAWREHAAKWHDEQSRRINNLPLNTQRADFHRECAAALAPATEGRKS